MLKILPLFKSPGNLPKNIKMGTLGLFRWDNQGLLGIENKPHHHPECHAHSPQEAWCLCLFALSLVTLRSVWETKQVRGEMGKPPSVTYSREGVTRVTVALQIVTRPSPACASLHSLEVSISKCIYIVYTLWEW